jgi:hypothetical protein
LGMQRPGSTVLRRHLEALKYPFAVARAGRAQTANSSTSCRLALAVCVGLWANFSSSEGECEHFIWPRGVHARRPARRLVMGLSAVVLTPRLLRFVPLATGSVAGFNVPITRVITTTRGTTLPGTITAATTTIIAGTAAITGTAGTATIITTGISANRHGWCYR